MEENSSISEHVLRMSAYADKLIALGITIPNELGYIVFFNLYHLVTRTL